MAKLEMVGLGARDADKFPSELSGGMTKRVALARALALDPEIVFLDEPTSGLDPIAAGDFDMLIRTLQQTLGLTVFMVTHDLESLAAVCDRIAALADGKVVAAGPVASMRASEHPWVKAYFQGRRAREPSEHCATFDLRGTHGNSSAIHPDRHVHARRYRSGLRFRLLAEYHRRPAATDGVSDPLRELGIGPADGLGGAIQRRPRWGSHRSYSQCREPPAGHRQDCSRIQHAGAGRYQGRIRVSGPDGRTRDFPHRRNITIVASARRRR